MTLHFAGPYIRQNWSIPDSILYYITMQPSSSKTYQKLIQSCKYFFSKNPIIVLQCLHFYEDGWKTCAFSSICEMKTDEMRKLDFENISAKFWIKELFHLRHWNFSITPSYFLPKLYRMDGQHCYLYQQTMTLNQLLFLASSADRCMLRHCTVIDEVNGLQLHLEAIVANLPKIEKLKVEFIPNAPNISSNSVKELLKLPHFSKMKKLMLYQLPENFDIDTLFAYSKEITDLELDLFYGTSISDAYKQHLETVIDEILEIPFPSSYRTPFINFDGQNRTKRVRLLIRRDC